MSWHFSRAWVEESLAGSCSDGEQFVRSSTTGFAEKSLCGDKRTRSFNPSQFGTTQKHLTGNLGIDTWISSLPASRVSLIPQQGKEKEKKTKGISGQLQFASYGKWDPDSSCWKTSQGFYPLIISARSLVTWRRQGTMRSGKLYRQHRLEHRTFAKGYGFLPTPSKMEAFPWYNQTLREREESGKQVMLGHLVGGPLNPKWIEWLMGFPINWTELHPLETHKCPAWQQWLSSFSQVVQGFNYKKR